MKGLTFYKLISPYKEDKTKNCGLTGIEIDDNFFNLKEELIKDAYWENDVFVLERVNGDIIAVSGITEGCAKDLDIKYDKDEGALVVNMNGTTTLITGFTTQTDFNTTVYSDDTLSGKGTLENPLSLSPIVKTGQYKPAIKLIDTTRNEKLPNCKTLAIGDRYVTVESISDFGYLYDYNGVSKISADLRDACSPWRVPTKEDWDNMLNAVEPRPEDRNHDKVTSNKYLGRFAGKLLKSINFWKLESNTPDCGHDDCNCNHGCNHDCGSYSKDITYEVGCEERDPYCAPSCGEPKPNCTCHKPNPYPNRGIDKYGFSAVPAGYGDDGDQIGYFSERGWYWTATNSQCLNAYTKRFEYDKSTVFQEIIGVNNLLSLRLVKDYDGSNYNERESILDSDYSTVLMPSKNGKTIWTSTNVAFSNRYYNPIAPNNGIGLTFSKKFFVNEWNGKRWLKNELKNGDSIVFIKAPNGGNNVEYRVINGTLANVAEAIYDDVIITIRPELDNLKGMIVNEIIRAKEAERQLQSNIDTETARAVFAEQQLQRNIDAETARAQTAEEQLQTNINVETERAKAAEEQLQANIDAETSERNEADEQLQKNIDAEAERAKEAEELLQANIDAETARAIEAEELLQRNIDIESERAKEAEEQLQKNIDIETERATEAEELLDVKIELEISRATEAENALDEKIDNLAEKEAADIAEVKDLIKKEEERATEAEMTLEANLNSEIERATTKENEIEAKLDAEIERSTTKDAEIDAEIETIKGNITDTNEKIDAVDKKLDEEIERATSKENEIEANLNAEIERATAKENEIEANLNAEIERATTKENEIEAKLDAEIERSETKDVEIETKLDAEIERSVEQDKLITEKLLKQTGHKFNIGEGMLELKTNNPDNNINIDLDFNFGTF